VTIRRLFTICTLAAALAIPALTDAAPSRSKPKGAVKVEADEGKVVGAALKKWAAGDWVSVRSLLEPLISSGRPIADPLLAESALRYLADATLLDESLDTQIRTQLAMSYIGRLFDADPDWRPPPDTHGQALYDLYNQMREQYERAKLAQCLAERASCDADLDDLTVRHARLRGDHEALKQAFGQQEVEVREKVARNRAIAMLPLGIGHFYNGRKGLGAAFLAGEAVTGIVALGLLAKRSTQCNRTNGFARGSLVCTAEDPEALVTRRNLETGFSIAFVSLVLVDIIAAQVTFQPFATVKTERIKREDLEAQPEDETKPRTKRAPRPARQARLTTRDNLQLRPHPALFRGGGGAGFTLRF